MEVENIFFLKGDIKMDNRPIGLLDSGDGGFSVVKKLLKNYLMNLQFLLVIMLICLMVKKANKKLLS